MFKLCVLLALVASALSAPVEDKKNTKRGLFGFGGYGYPVGLGGYHGFDDFHAPYVSHAPIVSHAPLVSHAPIVSHAPFHAPLSYGYSAPYFGYGHYPYYH